MFPTKCFMYFYYHTPIEYFEIGAGVHPSPIITFTMQSNILEKINFYFILN